MKRVRTVAFAGCCCCAAAAAASLSSSTSRSLPAVDAVASTLEDAAPPLEASSSAAPPPLNASSEDSSASSDSDVVPSIYDSEFTSIDESSIGIIDAVERCDERDLHCAGVSLPLNGTLNSRSVLCHSYVGPHGTERTKRTIKKYTYHRGRVTSGSVLGVDSEISVIDAKTKCDEDEACVGFTYPSRSDVLRNVRFPDNVTFYSTLEGFEPSPEDEWRTYVTNDLIKTSRPGAVNGRALAYDDDVRRDPYKRCCTSDRTSVPTMEELEKADTMERISCDISREEFFLKYELPRKPVMLVGCEKDWPAVKEKKWTYDNLATRFGNSSLWRARLGTESESYDKSVPWSKISDAMHYGTPFYVFDQLKDEEAKSLDDDYDDPKPVRNADLYQKLVDKEVYFAGQLRWFCLGKRGSGTVAHVDPFHTDAWNTLIKGHKWWVFYPQELTDASDMSCDDDCSVDKPFVKHWYGSIGINAARTEYPVDRFGYHVLQKPGETIYAPDMLIHAVFNMDDTVAITKNFASAANLAKVWEATVTSGDPIKWKTLYYHTLDARQRKFVRNTEYWHPSEWEDKEEEEDSIDHDEGKRRYDADDVDVIYHAGFDPEVGDVVEARFNGVENEWYKAKVTKVRDPLDSDVNATTTYDVEYDDGDVDERLPRSSVRSYVPLRVGEIVQARYVKKNGDAIYVKAVVTATANADGEVDEDEEPTVNVRHYDGEEFDDLPVTSVRRFHWRYMKGDKTASLYRGGKDEIDGDRWFRGKISKSYDDGTYDVLYDDGDTDEGLDGEFIKFLWAADDVED